MNILNLIGIGLKSAAKGLGNGLLNLGKSFASGISNSMFNTDITGNIYSGVDNLKSEIKSGVNNLSELYDRSNESTKPSDITRDSVSKDEPESDQQIISYRNLDTFNIKSDNPKLIDELIRHNKESERLLSEEIKLKNKVRQDKLGLDILESQRLEYYRNLELERQLKIDQENKKLREEELRRQRSIDELNRSKGYTEEGDLTKNELTESTNSDQSESGTSDQGDSTNPLVSTSLGLLGGNLINKAKGKIGNLWTKLKSNTSTALSKTTKSIKNTAVKVGKKVLGDRGYKIARLMSNPKALVKVGKKMLSKIFPILPKLAAKMGMTMAKTGVKSALKQVPVLGIAMGIGEAISDISDGDYIGAGLAALSGVAPTLNLVAPGLGTAISMGLIGADIARDVLKGPVDEAIKVLDDTDIDKVMNEPDIDLSTTLNESSENGNQELTDYTNQPTQGQSTYVPNLNYVPEINQELTSNPIPKPKNRYRSSQLENQMKAFDILTKDGFSPEAASGVIGCLMAESGMNPQAVNKLEKEGKFPGSKANGPGYGAGLAQWSLNRKKSVLDYLKSNHVPEFGDGSKIEDYGLESQMGAVVNEIKSRPELYKGLMNPNITPNQATDLALRGYENGSKTALAKVGHIDKYTWDGGYLGAMYGKSASTNGKGGYGRVNYATDALNNYLNSTKVTAESLATNPSITGSEVTGISTNPIIPKVSQNTESSKNKETESNPILVSKGGDYAPVINQGSSNVTIINNRSDNDLNIELLG